MLHLSDCLHLMLMSGKQLNNFTSYSVSSNPGYSYTAFDELMYKDSGRCVGKAFHSEIDVLKWKAYSKSDRQFINIPKPTTRLGFPVKVTFVRNSRSLLLLYNYWFNSCSLQRIIQGSQLFFERFLLLFNLKLHFFP